MHSFNTLIRVSEWDWLLNVTWSDISVIYVTAHILNAISYAPHILLMTAEVYESQFTKFSFQFIWHWSHNNIFKRKLFCRIPVFSSPEPKAQVSYCHSAPSVVRPSVRRPSVNFYVFNFFSRTAWWILMTLGRDEVLMVPYKCCCFSARSAQGRIQGGAKIGHVGSPSSRIFFFRPKGYSNKPNA